jgi:hypothetical protein
MMLDTMTRDMPLSSQVEAPCPTGHGVLRVQAVAMAQLLCCVCGLRPVRAKNRCKGCGEYLRRKGYDRSVAMTDRQRDRDQDHQCRR